MTIEEIMEEATNGAWQVGSKRPKMPGEPDMWEVIAKNNNGRWVALTQKEADAELIVLAVSTLRALIKVLERLLADCPDEEAQARVEAALALAKAGRE